MRQMSPLYASVFVASMLFPALATIFKEKIFTDAKQKLGGKQLDIFVVRAWIMFAITCNAFAHCGSSTAATAAPPDCSVAFASILLRDRRSLTHAVHACLGT